MPRILGQSSSFQHHYWSDTRRIAVCSPKLKYNHRKGSLGTCRNDFLLLIKHISKTESAVDPQWPSESWQQGRTVRSARGSNYANANFTGGRARPWVLHQSTFAGLTSLKRDLNHLVFSFSSQPLTPPASLLNHGSSPDAKKAKQG